MAQKRRTPTKWVSSSVSGGIPDSASVATADAVSLAGSLTTAVVNRQNPTVVSVRGQISISRASTAANIVAIQWAIVLMRKEFNASNPVQTFTPFSTIDLEERNILAMGMCDAPPIMFTPSNDALATDRRANVYDIHVKVSRKLRNQEDGLFFWIVSTDSSPPGTDDAFNVIGNFRTLLAWPGS